MRFFTHVECAICDRGHYTSNDVLLEQLANDGTGNYAYVDSLAEAQKLFVDDLTSTLQAIALDATPARAGVAREVQVHPTNNGSARSTGFHLFYGMMPK